MPVAALGVSLSVEKIGAPIGLKYRYSVGAGSPLWRIRAKHIRSRVYDEARFFNFIARVLGAAVSRG